MVKYVQDFNAGKASGRRFLHGRKGFYFIDQQNRNDKKQQIDQQE